MKPARTLLLVFAVTLAGTPAFAQKKKKKPSPSRPGTVSYTVDSNDPANAPNLSFTASPVYADIYTLNMNLGYFAEANYRLDNRWEFNAFYRGSYIDRFKKSTGNPGMRHGFSDDENKGVRTFGGSVMFYFKDDLSVINEEVTLRLHNNGSVQTKYVLQLPAKRLQLFGLRAGFEQFASSVYSGNNAVKYTGTLLSADTSVYTADLSSGRYSTYAKTTMVTLGFCRTRISDIHISTDKYGKKATAAVSQLYVDVLFSTSTVLSDMNVVYANPSGAYDGSVYYPYAVSAPLSKIGVRAGFTEHVNFKFRPLGMFGAEAGLRPGVKAGFDSFYLLIKFGLNLSLKAGTTRSFDDGLDD